MKKFSVSKDCNACGRCTLLTDLLLETPDGKAKPSETKYISDDFIIKANEIVAECPVGALKVVETGNTAKSGKAGLIELVQVLKSKLNDIPLPHPTKADIQFNADKYYIECGYPKGEYNYSYSSESQAERAALDEFNRIAYSQYRTFILSVFVQYKNDKLKPYYTIDRTDNSYYHQINSQYEKVLNDIQTEAKAISDGKVCLTDDFSKFNAFPWNSNKFILDYVNLGLKEFETQSTCSGVMAEFNSGSYSSLSSYSMYIDTDDQETYQGTDWLGNDKYKYKYCYKSIGKAVDEYIKDLKSAMKYADIDEKAYYFLEGIITPYQNEIKKEIENKLNIFSKAIDSCK